MRQTSHTRHTQQSARRRSHLGVLFCLMAALFFTGVLLGRLSDDQPPPGHIYLSETAPPAAAKKTTPSPKRAQPRADRIAREVTTGAPRGKARAVRPTPSPTDEVRGFTAEDPTRVHGEETVQTSPAMASQVVSLTNAARAKKGCGPLRVDARLTRSARVHSLEMARSGRFGHDSPDGSSPWDRMERAGYRAGAAENIGRGYTSPEEAVSGWLGNPDHRQNILNCRIQAIGVGVADGPGGPWWTQDFGYS
ncbi:CAP domain-containing protein [Nonomuraea lactucae]|uniref:CAP domain-containing protein n=1 Tax=Nonomuraea lactucae TaxID=2249762 RepID=UPI000DE397E4|nr:CAP domain-containing protein [Nonomuraea lactucae]